jgi:hypothetical protein
MRPAKVIGVPALSRSFVLPSRRVFSYPAKRARLMAELYAVAIASRSSLMHLVQTMVYANDMPGMDGAFA